VRLYLLLEGKRSEAKIYPAWLASLDNPFEGLVRVDQPIGENERAFFCFSANGYPSIITTHLPNAIADLKKYPVYDWLLVCLDVDESSAESRISEVENAAKDLVNSRTKIFVVPQSRCIESWLLGNPKLIGAAPPPYVAELRNFYDVRRNCPECMGFPRNWSNHAQFHFHYLKEVFKAKNMTYSKSNPGDAASFSYLKALVGRVERDATAMGSFQRFLRFISSI
jgi:hypothetical protein